MMKLHGDNRSSSSRRVSLTAAVLGLQLERVPVDLMTDRPRLATINPNVKIPVLEDGDFLLWESHAIMAYLCAKTPGQTLLPGEPRARAEVDRWLYWVSAHLGPAVGAISFEKMWKKLVTGGEPDPVVIARHETLLHAFAKVLDDHLATRTWLAGPSLGLPDLSTAATLMYAKRTALPLGGYRHVNAWLERVHALPAWRETEPSW